MLLEFLRWLCSSLVAPSWKVLGSAPSSMVNSGVFSSNSAIRTTWAACAQNQNRLLIPGPGTSRTKPVEEPLSEPEPGTFRGLEQENWTNRTQQQQVMSSRTWRSSGVDSALDLVWISRNLLQFCRVLPERRPTSVLRSRT